MFSVDRFPVAAQQTVPTHAAGARKLECDVLNYVETAMALVVTMLPS